MRVFGSNPYDRLDFGIIERLPLDQGTSDHVDRSPVAANKRACFPEPWGECALRAEYREGSISLRQQSASFKKMNQAGRVCDPKD